MCMHMCWGSPLSMRTLWLHQIRDGAILASRIMPSTLDINSSLPTPAAGALCAHGVPAWRSGGSGRLGSRRRERSRSGSGGCWPHVFVFCSAELLVVLAGGHPVERGSSGSGGWLARTDSFKGSAQGWPLHCWRDDEHRSSTAQFIQSVPSMPASNLHRRAAAATDASLRYDWVEGALSSGRLAAGECPVCGADAQAAGRAATEAAHRPTSAGTGAGLNVAAASFLPHAYTDEHQAAAAAFRQFAELYRQHMALPLAAAATLAARLNAVTEGAKRPIHHAVCLSGAACCTSAAKPLAPQQCYITMRPTFALRFPTPPPSPPAGASFALAMGQAATLQEAADAARSALAAYDSQRQWGDHAALLDMAAALQKACLEADAWLDSYERMQAGRAGSSSAAAGSGLSEHERAAAELQAELQAHAAAAAGDDGWTAVGRGGRAAGPAAAEADELEDVDVSANTWSEVGRFLVNACRECPLADWGMSWWKVEHCCVTRLLLHCSIFCCSWPMTTSTACWKIWRPRLTRRAAGGGAAAARRRARAGGRAAPPSQAVDRLEP